MLYQFFGSDDSRDIDVVFFVDMLPATVAERLLLCKKYTAMLRLKMESPKAINGNLAVIANGQLTDVYKGTTDELNNALFETSRLHEQDFDNQVLGLLVRDVDLKFIRCARMLLSALSRTIFRKEVKLALRSSLSHKLQALRGIDLQLIGTTNKGYNLLDLKKVLAFQLGQTLALHSGKEIYTKRNLIDVYPNLTPYLQRIPNAEMQSLNGFLNIFLAALAERIPQMKSTEEYPYKLLC